MPQLYRILTAVLAVTGCISLVMSGEVSPLMSLTGIGLFPGYYRFLRGLPCAPKWAISGFSLLTLLVFFFDSLVISNDYFLGIAHLTITFQAIKSFDLKEPWDHLQVYFMALLQLIIASVLMSSIAFGIIFVLFLIAFVAAIVFAHFIKEGVVVHSDLWKPIVYISLLILVINVVFFVSIPRVSSGLLGKSHLKKIKSVGFSEKVNLGSFGKFKLDPTIIMRIELDPMIPGPYYWRGMTLDYYDGTSWNNTLIRTRRSVKKIEDEFVVQPFSGRTITQKIMLELIDSDVIFGLDRIVSIKGNFYRLEKDPATSLYVPRKSSERLQYIVVSDKGETIQLESTVLKHGERYLDIPDYMRYKLKTFTETIIKSERARHLSDLQKSNVIEEYLKKNYTYSLNVKPPADNIDPVLYFLFTSKTGFCEHYASTMALMLRSIGIPARVVTGFLGGELNEYGSYIIVRQSNAHSWVEALIDDKWMRFDPTPPVSIERHSAISLFLDMLRLKWNRYVIAFSISDQKEIVKAFSSPFRLPSGYDFRLKRFYGIIYFLLILSCIVLVLFFLRHLRFRRYGFVTAQYMKFRKAVKNKGAAITLSSTPSEVKKEAVQFGMGSKGEEFIKLYEESRFGGKEMKGEDRARYQNLMDEIKRNLR
jgi:hypothetical protein